VEETKHYNLPKDVLCYYSPVLDRCLNGGFKEAKELKLTLPEDDPFMFELLMGYMFGGMGEVEFSKDPGESYDYCWEFIEYTEKYDVTDACIILEKEMAQLITEHEEGKFNMDKTEHKGNFVKPIFDYSHNFTNSVLRWPALHCLVAWSTLSPSRKSCRWRASQPKSFGKPVGAR
jgi:hypothetical protein